MNQAVNTKGNQGKDDEEYDDDDGDNIVLLHDCDGLSSALRAGTDLPGQQI